jgi:hypothetical protein
LTTIRSSHWNLPILLYSNRILLLSTAHPATAPEFLSFNNLPQGDYLLSSTFVGYDKTFTPVTNLDKSRDLGNIVLQTSDIALKEATVTGSMFLPMNTIKQLFSTS